MYCVWALGAVDLMAMMRMEMGMMKLMKEMRNDRVERLSHVQNVARVFQVACCVDLNNLMTFIRTIVIRQVPFTWARFFTPLI